MKLKHISIISILAFAAASCVTTENTVTTPDGTVTKTKVTTLSGADIATVATGIGGAVDKVSSDK